MAVAPTRQRLAPDVFRLPVDKIREGYYSDAYFNHTKTLLEEEGHRPSVHMQVFQKHDSVLGGIDEAVAVLKLCSGERGLDGGGVDGWPRLDVRALHEGGEIAPPEPVLTIEGGYAPFAPPANVYLGCL